MKSGTFASDNEHTAPQQAGEYGYFVPFGLSHISLQINTTLFESIVSNTVDFSHETC